MPVPPMLKLGGRWTQEDCWGSLVSQSNSRKIKHGEFTERFCLKDIRQTSDRRHPVSSPGLRICLHEHMYTHTHIHMRAHTLTYIHMHTRRDRQKKYPDNHYKGPFIGE